MPPYRRIDDKLADARAYRQDHQIPWPVVTDDLRGTVHQAYGGLSDPAYLIDVDGRVAFYNMVSHAPALHRAIARLQAQQGRGVVHGGIDRIPYLLAPLVFGWPALQRGLPQSVIDLMFAAPGAPILLWLGDKLRPLLKPLAERARPLPTAARVGLLIAGGLLLLVIARYLPMPHNHLPKRERTRERDRVEGPDGPGRIPGEAHTGLRPLQLTGEGAGPLFHRRYRADIVGSKKEPKALMARIQSGLNEFCPVEMAYFEKMKGQEGSMAVGDEYNVHITGPWDGPVRVIEVTPTSFTLVTLEGHIEAGEIRFQVVPHPTNPRVLRFEIHSWARSRDNLINLIYDKAKVGQVAQASMWVHFIEEVVGESGGTLLGQIDVLTEKIPFEKEVIPGES